MTYFLVLLFALLIGVVAGLRALTAPAVVAWAGALGWINLDDTWAQWVAHPITVAVLTVLASQLLPLLARLLAGPRRAQSFPVFWRNLRHDAANAVAQVRCSPPVPS